MSKVFHRSRPPCACKARLRSSLLIGVMFVLPLCALAPSHQSKGSRAAPASAGRCPALRVSLPPERGERCPPRGGTDDCRCLVSVITSTETDNRLLFSLARRDPKSVLRRLGRREAPASPVGTDSLFKRLRIIGLE